MKRQAALAAAAADGTQAISPSSQDNEQLQSDVTTKDRGSQNKNTKSKKVTLVCLWI